MKKSLLLLLGLLPLAVFANAPAKKTSTAIKSQPQCYYLKQYDAATKKDKYVLHCRARTEEENQPTSAVERRLRSIERIVRNRYGISFFEPTYILPLNYTMDPAESAYPPGSTPNNQKIMKLELKGQMSFLIPVWIDMFHSTYSLNVSYTQLIFWQVYAESQYFRETDYEPAIFVSHQFSGNTVGFVGFVHQSNGRGGDLERSWNRLFINFAVSGQNWLLSINPWLPIFKKQSSNLHNPDIYRYLGYERIVFAYKFHDQELSAMLRNSVESGFKRMALQISYSFPIHGVVHGYFQYFTGYGQSLIEYKQRTNSFGAGISLSNWI